MTDTEFDKRVRALIKKLSDDGTIIRAGWISYRHLVMPPNAPDVQVRECQMAFFAGAQHLFASIMDSLDPDKEPTESDLKRMDLIDKELRDFVGIFRDIAMPPKGNA